MKRRVLSLMMALVIFFTMLPTSALAQDIQTPAASAPAVEDTKDVPKVTDPTTAPTVAVTTPAAADTTPTEGGTLPTEGNAAPQNGGDIAVHSSAVAKVGDTEYETVQEILEEMSPVEITLLGNVTEDITVYAATTIHMGGFRITGTIDAADSLTLKNGTVKGTVKMDGGTFTMTAPADAAAAIDGGLNVVSGSCSVSGAKIGVKGGPLTFGGDDLVITGTEKAVALDNAAGSKTFYGSATESGAATTEAVFEDGTYKVGGEIAKKLTSKQADAKPTEPVTLTLTPTEQAGKAGTTIAFTAAYDGTDELNVYVQGNSLEDYYFTFDQTDNGDGTRTITVKIDADVPTGDYTLYVHEVKDSFVQAKATITVTGLPDVAEVGGVKYKSLPKALAAAKDGDTVTMLANHVTEWDAVDAGDLSTLAVVTKKLTLELNGKAVDYLEVGEVVPDEEGGILESTDGNLTVVNNGGGSMGKIIDLNLVKGTLDIQGGQIGDYDSGRLTCHGDSGTVTISGGMVLGLTVGEGASVTVSGGSIHAGSWFNDGTLNITGGTFSNVYFSNNGGTIAISGGTFGSICNEDASSIIPPMLLLAKGYAFYDQYDETLKDGSVRDALKNVTVKPHTHTIENGKCDCGLAATVSDSKGDFYNTLQDALNAAAKDSTIQWVQLEQDLTEQVTFNAEGASVTVRMNGKTLTAPNNDAPAVAVSSGTLIFADAATINMPTTADPYNQTITYAVSISGGKLVFQGNLTAEGGVFNISGNRTVQMPAVYANGGELDFQGDLDLKSGLTISGNAKLTRKLTQGTFRTDYMEGDRLSVTGASNYKYLEYLLEDGYAFVDKDDHNVFRCVSSFTFWSGSDVTIVPHEHTWGPDGELYSCTACGKSCGHPDGYPDGKCPVCGKPCPHAIADQSPVDHKYYCNDCHEKMVARIQTDTYAWSHFTNLKDAMAAAEDGQTVLLLDDIDNSGLRAVVTGDGKTVTLDLNGHTVTGGWIQAGYENWSDQTASTLKIVGSGSFINTGTYGNLSVGYKATVDLSGWVGENNTISRVSMSKRGGDEAELIVSESIGTIGSLGFNSWPSSGIKTKLTGGTYGEISIVVQYDSEPYSSMLAPGYAFQYIDTGDYVNCAETATNQGNTIKNVKVVKCTHGGTNGFEINSTNTCPYCGTPAVAQTALKDVEGDPWRNFADLQTAIDANRDGSSELRLLTDVTGDYTIDGTTITGLDLNGHSINGTVYVTGGGKDTTLSNTKNTTTASIDTVVASAGAKLAGSGYPAVIGTLKLAEGATWAGILQQPTRLGFKVKNEDGTHTWYAPADVPAESTELKNVIINSLPITSKSLSFRVNGKTVTSVERGTTVQLCAYCNTSGADVYIYTGVPAGDGTFDYSQKEAEYKKIGTTWYYVVDFDANKIGTYSVYFTASKDGYSVSSDPRTLTVTKATIPADAITAPTANTLTYNGHPQELVTAGVLDAKYGTILYSLTRSASSFSTEIPEKTDAGTYTVYYKVVGAEGYKDSTVKSIKVTISPIKIDHVMFVNNVTKTYSGSAEFSLATAERYNCLKFYGEASSLIDVDPGDYAIDGTVRFLAKNAEDEFVDSPEAGQKSYMQFTVKLHSKNYVLQTPDGTAVSELTCIQSGGATFTIDQATVTPADEITQLIFNDLAKTYEIDLRAFLPELPVGCEYGKILNRGCDFHFTDSTYLDSSNNIFVSNEGILTLPIVSAHSANVNDQIGTVTVPIVSTNYRQFDLTIRVVIGEKITLDQSGVSVSATDITYGQTLAESTLTATGSMICPRMKTEIPGTFAWTDGTIKPNAGSYDAEWTFTPAEGYEEYAPATGKVTIKVNPAQLQNVSVIQALPMPLYYTGQPQRAGVSAAGLGVCGERPTFTYSAEENGTYTSEVPAFTDAGTYTVYYKAEAANHEPTTGSFTVSIAPLPISFLSVEKISKSYDGTANVTLSASMLTFFSKTASVSDIKLPDTALTFSDAQFTMKQADGSYLPSPEAGDGKALSFTMTLASDNYVFERKPEGAETVKCDYATDDTTRFTITKAAAPTNIQAGTLNVINGTTLTYTYDSSKLLPAAPKGEYGVVYYGGKPSSNFESGYEVNSCQVGIYSGVLTLTIDAQNGGKVGKIGSFLISVTTDNYETFRLPVDLNAINQITPVADGDITASEITYGDALSTSKISGKMKDPNTGETVSGTFAWKDGTILFNAGSRKAEWTFTPDAPEYAAVTGKVEVTVNPKSIVGAVVTLEDTFVYDGTEKWPNIISVVLDGVTLTGVGRGTDYGFSCNRTSQVGTYYDDFSIGGEGNYTGELKFTWSITPREVTPTITVADGTYDGGNPVQPTVTLTDDLGNTIDPKEYDVSYSDNTNAGTGTVTITDKEGGNYVLGTASTTFTINKAAAPALTAHRVTQKYSLKTEQTITLPDLKNLGMPDDAQVSDTNAFHSGSYSPAGKIEDGWGFDVNTGAITYALADDVAPGDVITFTLLVRSKNYEDATVTVILILTERDAPILTLPDIITVDYTGAEIPVSVVTGKSAAFGGKDVPGTWSWKDGQAITNATDTGNKTIVFTPDDLVNYHPVEGEVYVIISRVAPDYTAPTAMDGLIYNGSAQALVKAGSTAHGKLLYSLSKDGAYSETIPTGTDAGEYTVWYKVEGDSNHKDSQPASVTVTIAPKTVTATVTVSGGSLTYTGDPLKPDVIVKDGDTVISPDEYDVSYKDNVNAGTATVTIKNKAGGNYTVSGSTTFEIGKAASEVKTAPGANTGLVYNGGEQTLITAGTALGGKLKYRLGGTGEFTEDLPKATDAGTYTVYYMVEGDGNHRDSAVQSLTVTIDKAKVTVKALDKSIYTDDKAPDLSKPVLDKDYTVSALFGEDALTGDIKLAYVDASGTEITPDTTKVGKVIIRASGLTAPNGNYTVVFVDGTLAIDERPVYTIKATAGIHGSITPSGDIDVLHGGSQTFSIAANSGYAISNVKIDGVSIGAVKSYTFENVTGNHTIAVTFMKANGNPQTGVMVDEVTGEYYVG